MPQKSNIWYSCLRQKASEYLRSVKLCKISQTEAGSRKKRIWSNPSILQLSKFYLSWLEPCHVWGKSDWNMQNMSNIQIKILCGCILIHHYLCGNYWCFNKSVSHDACAVAVCLFCKRDSFFIRLAACGENARHLTLRFNVWICIFILICTCRMDEIWLSIKISGKPDLISHKREITTPAHDCRWYTFPKQNKCKTEPFCQGDNISHIQFWRDCLLQKVEDRKK